jgi:phosphate-selective porin OprO/OprP
MAAKTNLAVGHPGNRTRRRGRLKAFTTSFLAAVLLFSFAHEPVAKTELTASWNKGIRLDGGAFKLKLGGRIQNDWAWFQQSDAHKAAYGDWQDGTEFRRIRLYMSGTVYDWVVFKAQYDFAGAGEEGKEVVVKDMFIGVNKLPFFGTLLIGHQKEPFSLEQLTSSKYITFMERSPLSVIDSERNNGIAFHNHYSDSRMTLAAGYYRDSDSGGRSDSEDAFGGTARFTGVPWHNPEKNSLVHLGASFSVRQNLGEVELKMRPSSHLAGTMVRTGAIEAKKVYLFVAEGALVRGPWSLQTEWKSLMMNAPAAGDPTFWGVYVDASWFITGESRKYKATEGRFDRTSPKTNYREGGSGAWQVAARLTYADLNNKSITGGILTDVVLGLNWYLNPNVRAMVNYVYAKADDVGSPATDNGHVNIIETRFQIDF